MSEAMSQWKLFRHSGKIDQFGLGHEVTAIRDIGEAEYHAIIQQKNLIEYYLERWPWDRVTAAVNEFIQMLNTAVDVANRSSYSLNQADVMRANSALKEASRLASDWLAELQLLTPDDDHDLSAILKELSSASKNDAVKLFVGLSEGEQVDIVSIVPVSLAPLMVELHINSAYASVVATDMDLIGEIQKAISSLEIVAAEELALHRSRLESACSAMRSLALECVYGEPELISAEQIRVLASDPGSFTPIKLPIHKVDAVMARARQGKEFLKQRQMRASTAAQEPAEMPRPSETPKPPDAQAATANPKEGERVQPADTLPIISLEALLEEVSNLPTEIERKWSHGLAGELKADNGILKNRFLSLANAVVELGKEVERNIHERGKSTTIRRFPLTVADASTIKVNCDADEFDYQVLLAELYAIRAFRHALVGLEAPILGTFNVSDEHATTWWDAGAFSEVKHAASLLVQISQIRSSDQEYQKPKNVPWQFRAQLVHRAVAHQLHEAALVHALGTIYALDREDGFESSNAPDSFTNPRFEGLRDGIEELRTAVLDIAAGNSIYPATAVCMAWYWSDVFRTWIRAQVAKIQVEAETLYRTRSESVSNKDGKL